MSEQTSQATTQATKIRATALHPIERAVREFQNANKRLRYCRVPVVAAPTEVAAEVVKADIVPLYWVRGFAVLEGLLGIALAGAFLVSLTRRYIE